MRTTRCRSILAAVALLGLVLSGAGETLRAHRSQAAEDVPAEVLQQQRKQLESIAKAEAMQQAATFLTGFTQLDDLERWAFEKAVRKPFDDALWAFDADERRRAAQIEKAYPAYKDRLPHLRQQWKQCDQFNATMIQKTLEHVRTHLDQGRYPYLHAYCQWYRHCYSDNEALVDRQDREGRYAGPQLIAQALQKLYDDVADRLQHVSDGVTQKTWTCRTKSDPQPPAAAAGPVSLQVRRFPVEVDEFKQVQQLAAELREITAARQGTTKDLPTANPWHFPRDIHRDWQLVVDGKPQGTKSPERSFSLQFNLLDTLSVYDGITKHVDAEVSSFIGYDANFRQLIREAGFQQALTSWRNEFLEIKATHSYLMLRSRWHSLVFIHTKQGLFQAEINANATVPDQVDADDLYRVEWDVVKTLTYRLIDEFTGSPAPPGPEPAPGPTLRLAADAKDNEVPPGQQCRIVATLLDPRQMPVAGARIAFRRILGPGSLSNRVVTTNAAGQGVVVFTAPTQDDLAKLGVNVRVTTVEAIEPESKVEGRLELTTRATPGASLWDLTVAAGQKIVPAYPVCYNPIEITVVPRQTAATPTTDAQKPVRLKIALRSQGPQVHGRLVRTEGDPGGAAMLNVDHPIGRPLTVYYHWTGQGNLPRAVVETVEVSVDELKLSGKATFDVGVDFRVKSVARIQTDEILPFFEQLLFVEVIDNFHPDADLVSLVKTWDIMPRLTLTQTEFSIKKGDLGSGVLSFLVETLDEGYKSAFWGATIDLRQRVEAWSIRKIDGKTPGNAVAPGQTEKSGRQVLYSDAAWDVHHQERRPFPRVVFFSRGTHELEFQINRVLVKGAEGLDHTDQAPVTWKQTIAEYDTKGDKFLYTVLLPTFEYIELLGASKAVSIAATTIGCLTTFYSATETAMEGTNLTPDQYNAYRLKALREITNVWSCLADIATMGNLPKSVMDGLKMNLHANFVKEMLLNLKEIGWGDLASAPGTKTVRGDELENSAVVDVIQASLRGLNGQYVVIVDRRGLKSLTVTSSSGGQLSAAPEKVPTPQQMQSRGEVLKDRLWEKSGKVFIPALAGETLQLNLVGDGSPGRALVMTGTTVRTINYPASPWTSTVTVQSNGEIQSDGGTQLPIGAMDTLISRNPPTAITPVPEVARPDASQLHVSAASVRRGETIEVQFSGGKDFAGSAWIGLVPATIPHGPQKPNDAAKVVYRVLRGKPWGKLTFTIPPAAPPGDYQFRMFPSDDDSFDEVAGSETIRIQ